MNLALAKAKFLLLGTSKQYNIDLPYGRGACALRSYTMSCL